MRGLNVLTGETGAGKSMLVDALALLLGERAAGGSVRPGAAKAIVEGAFEGHRRAHPTRPIEALGLDVEDRRVVVRREVSFEGRSRAWVNGSPTTGVGAWRSSAPSSSISTASTRPNRCSTPTPSATSSMPSPMRRPSAAPSRRRTRPLAALRS